MIFRERLLLTLITILFVFSTNCQNTGTIKNISVSRSPANMKPDQSQVPPPNRSQFADVDAVVAFNYDEEFLEKQKGIIRIYDENGNIWHEIDCKQEQHTEASIIGGKFRPFIFRPSDFFLTLRSTRVSKDWYEVIVNEEVSPKTKKYIRTNDKLLKFLTSEAYILNFSSVVFDDEENPILNSPAGNKMGVEYSYDTRFVPVEVKGEWLRMRWQPRESIENINRNIASDTTTSGWIRWRRDDKTFLIREFYP